MKRLALGILMLLSLKAQAQNKYQLDDIKEGTVTCPRGGDNSGAKFAKADSLKNRWTVPNKYKEIKISEMLQLSYTDKSHSENEAVYVHGYVVLVKDGGSETCNCHTKDKTFYDTHIVICNSKNDEEKDGVVVEITPRLRGVIAKEFGVTWEDCTTKYIRDNILGHEVIIKGYLFNDFEHHANSAADGGKGNLWRGTCWEIHPVSDVKVLD